MLRKTQILSWLVVLLLVLNAVTIGTIIYHQYQERRAAKELRITTAAGGQVLNGRFCRQVLGYSTDQMDEFREVNQAFRPTAMALTWQIDSLKEEMYTQLEQPSPDTTVLNALSLSIGELHGRLKYETYRFYIRMKSMSTEEQQEKLATAFRPLFKKEGLAAPGIHQQGPGWKRNQQE